MLEGEFYKDSIFVNNEIDIEIKNLTFRVRKRPKNRIQVLRKV